MPDMMDINPLVFDDVIKLLAGKDEQTPLVAYPREDSVTDFEHFTAQDLDVLVERAAKYYSELHIDPVQEPIVSLLGPSDLDYLITKFALSRLGFGILLLSTRLTPEACLKLLKENQCKKIVQTPSKLSFNLGDRTQALDSSISVFSIATGSVYRDKGWDSQTLVRPNLDPEKASQRTAIVYHSSGSTGLPKSIATAHERLLARFPTGEGKKAMTSSPLCHAYASKLTINNMMVGKCTYLTNSNMPFTTEALIEVCKAVQPDIFLAVPYILKLMAETDEGVAELVRCKHVVSSGSQLSDELGDKLVEAGANIEILFAGTEPGMVGSSMNRPPGDNAWNYFRTVPAIQQNVQYKPLGDNTFEFVYLKTLPTLNMSNSDDPPGSFHSSDIVTPHPTIPHAWKYIGRIDDRVTLSNGEKVLPLPMEGRVRQEALVREAVVFGIDRPIPGLLVFRSDAAKEMSNDDFVAAVWPAIEEANSAAEAFGRIDPEMVVCLPAGAQLPAADKESIIRAKVYKTYEQQIQDAYDRMDQGSEGGLELSQPELEKIILGLINKEVGIKLADVETDFHQAGMDSLQAIRLRGMIMRRVAVGEGQKIAQNIVFDSGNVQRLASKIVCNKDPGHVNNVEADNLPLMREMIERYTTFSPHSAKSTDRVSSHSLLLTGATGSLGAHLLSQLLAKDDVSEVTCIVRGAKPIERIRQALESRNLDCKDVGSKVKVVNGDLSQPNLGLDEGTFNDMKSRLTHIIHAAWPVNFQLGLRAFEPQLRGLQCLIQLSLSATGSSPARLLFCSSISAALATSPPAVIPEAPIENLEQAQATGYAQSKLVGEKVVEKAISEAGVDACVLRIGQIVGDTKKGIWNDTEAWPLIIRSALTLKALPEFDMSCSWLPVDVLASTIIDLTFMHTNSSTPTTFNLENPTKFHWTKDLLPALHDSGIKFRSVSPKEWLQQLTRYQKSTPAEKAMEQTPAVKLLDYFERLVAGSGEGIEEVAFDTTNAQECSRHLKEAPDVLETGLIKKFLTRWRERW